MRVLSGLFVLESSAVVTQGLEVVVDPFHVLHVLFVGNILWVLCLKSLICLFSDLERHIWEDSSVRVSLYVTIGSNLMICESALICWLI